MKLRQFIIPFHLQCQLESPKHGKVGTIIRDAVAAMRPAITEAPNREGFCRAYERPQDFMRSLPDSKAGLALNILYESGIRISEGTSITMGQLLGLEKDQYIGKEVGLFSYIGKGGKEGVAMITPATYQCLKEALNAGGGTFTVPQEQVRTLLKQAVEQSGQIYQGHGIHGLRWTHARERMDEIQQHGVSYDQGLALVSSEMDHERPEITRHYLES